MHKTMEVLKKIRIWLEEYSETGVYEPSSAVLSTIHDNNPTSRVVLVREINENGLVFFTNLKSGKARDIEQNNKVALNFHFRELKKQIRVEGEAAIIDDLLADKYFSSRTRDKQISSWASRQSEILESEVIFEERIKFFEDKFADISVPRPPFWSGYKVIPNYVEFWIEGPDRRHYRNCFIKKNNSWKSFKVYP
jgi:pyridoxamine 5'-phosphate oxidase